MIILCYIQLYLLREKIAAPQALSREDGKRLWELSEKLTAIVK